MVILQIETSPRVRQIGVPPEARELSTLSHVDYQDAFVTDVGPVAERTGEQWARAVLEGTPRDLRRSLRLGWSAIGLKLDRAPVGRRILGWEIRRETPQFALLGAESGVPMSGGGELLFKRHRRALLFCTFVQLDDRLARAAWTGIEPVHVPTVRRILDLASRRCRP
jgi:hypothetical protein